jgi:type I restriction enzyme M protein
MDYPVFMAVAEKVGYDRRGNRLFKRQPDGKLTQKSVETTEYRVEGGAVREIRRVRTVAVPDNDLPIIAERYHEFRLQNPEPGLSRTSLKAL